MEAELWRHVRHVHKQYYQVWVQETLRKASQGATLLSAWMSLAREPVAAALMDMQP